MTGSIYLWTRWNSSVISFSEIMCVFPSLLLSINSFFFPLISVLRTQAIRFCILSLSFEIYFETFYFIHHNLADSIPTCNKNRLPDHLSVPNWFSFPIRNVWGCCRSINIIIPRVSAEL